jgi:hypothetical protein
MRVKNADNQVPTAESDQENPRPPQFAVRIRREQIASGGA